MSKNKAKKPVSESEESEFSVGDESFSENDHKPQKNVLKRGQASSPKKKAPPTKKISKQKDKNDFKKEPEKKQAASIKKNNNKHAKDEKEPKEKDEKEGTSHFLPGQKHPTPTDGDGTRAFYESMYEQKPESKMAEKWCLEYGLLSKEKALEVLKKMEKGKKK